eukprot:534784_1
MRPHRLLFVPFLYILYLCTFLPQLSLSACIYNESYIYVNTANYPQINGAYIRNLARGILTQNPIWPHFDPPNCGRMDTPNYNGTYIYETETEPKHYLWMGNDANGNSLKIGDEICDSSHILFATKSHETNTLLDGTNCDWYDIDSEGTIFVQWYVGDGTDGAVTGSFLLCDSNEGCDTPLPTSQPTQSPVPTTAIPTGDPTTSNPTTAPTQPSIAPSLSPTKQPTTKPTSLPTMNQTLYLEPPCVALWVRNLDKAYPDQAAHNEPFNEIPDITYNQRRIWSNGGNGLEIFYTNRYEPNRWVISNGTYHLINDRDHLVDGGVNHSFPALGTQQGHALYDHFPNNNPNKIAEIKYTLQFTCQNESEHGTRFPTESPTPEPTQSPTLAPSTSPSLAPSMSPTVNCWTIVWTWTSFDANTSDVITDCTETAQFSNPAVMVMQEEQHSNHSYWRNVQQSRDEHLYYSHLWNGWVFTMVGETGNFGDHACFMEAPTGQEMPPQHGTWFYFDHGDIHAPHCSVDVELSCQTMIPTKTPTKTPKPSPMPTIAPSDAPTFAPSNAPTQPPSTAPSQPPTAHPTSAPTLLCGGLEVEIEIQPGQNEDYDAYYIGRYRREDDEGKNDKFWWQSINNAGSSIFYSDVIFHNSWVIQSTAAQTYWLYPEYNPYAHWLQPPLYGMWHYYTPLSTFAVDRRNITLKCTYSLLPTPAPSVAPSTTPTQPPTAAPSLAPSLAPSSAPSVSPSTAPTTAPTTPDPTTAPSNAPSSAPTQPPTREACAWMQVRPEDPLLDKYGGLYEEEQGQQNGFAKWVRTDEIGVYKIEKTGSELYWTINFQLKTDGGNSSLSIDDVVTMGNAYNWRPPVYGDWRLWQTRPNPTTAPTQPTFEPTTDPTLEPTLDPTIDPSMDPTVDPTSDPTWDPTRDPTMEPTDEPSMDPTHDPTVEPTKPTVFPTDSPTQEPTFEPTMEPSAGTVAPTKGPTMQPSGSPTRAPTLDTEMPTEDPTIEPTLPTRMPSLSPTFEPTVEPTSEPTVPTIDPIGGRRMLLQDDPPQGTQVYGTAYKIEMDCVNTGSPTVDPSTGSPTMAPTSICQSIRITSDDEFAYTGEYTRADYAVSGMYWFISYDGRSSLRYLHGAWRFQREDEDDGNDEDTILVYNNETAPDPLKWLRLSPQHVAWYAVYDDIHIEISIDCSESAPPTPAPSLSPSQAPSDQMAPVWMECKNNWFTLLNEEGNATYGVYWDVPKAYGEDTMDVGVDIVSNMSMIQEGDAMDVGSYRILYRATNIYNPNDTDPLSNDCEINLYVIAAYWSTEEYCLEHTRSVHMTFNETYQQIAFDAEEEREYRMNEVIDISGFATNPVLAHEEIPCYVFAQQITNLTVSIMESDGPTKSFLNIELDAIVWDVMIVIVSCCVCALFVFRVRVYYKALKDRDGASGSKTALLNEDLQRERVASAEVDDDDDLDLEDIAPGSTRNVIARGETNDGALLQAEPGRQAEYKPPAMMSEDGNEAMIQRNETAGAEDPAIDALIGEAFDAPVLVTPGPQPKGGDIEMQKAPHQPPPLGIRQSTFGTGGSLPDEPVPSDPDLYQSDPVLVTPDSAPIEHVASKVPDALDEDDEDYEEDEEEEEEEQHALQPPPPQSYQAVDDEAAVDRPVSNDEYEELEESDESEFEFR